MWYAERTFTTEEWIAARREAKCDNGYVLLTRQRRMRVQQRVSTPRPRLTFGTVRVCWQPHQRPGLEEYLVAADDSDVVTGDAAKTSFAVALDALSQ